jgi:hypothetical protein
MADCQTANPPSSLPAFQPSSLPALQLYSFTAFLNKTFLLLLLTFAAALIIKAIARFSDIE